VGHFDLSIDLPYLIEGVEIWGEPSVETEDLVLNHGCQWQEIEQICVVLPNIGISIFPQTLIVKTIHLCNLSRFMISAQNSDSILEPDFQANQEGNGLNRVVPSINVISHE